MDKKTLKQLQQEFNEIIDWFGSDQSDIDEAVQMYEKGMSLAEQIKIRLVEAENKITKIHKKFEQK